MSNHSEENSSLVVETKEDIFDHIDPNLYCGILGITSFLGVLGNCLIIIIFSTKENHRQSFSVYIRALAVSDSFVLTMTLIDDVTTRLIDWDIIYGNRHFCPVWLFFTFLVNTLSSALLISVAVDRYIVVVFPLRRARLCTYKRAKWTVFGISVLALCLSVPEYIWIKIEEGKSLTIGNELDNEYDCPAVDRLEYDIFIITRSSIFFLLVPFCVVTYLNVRVLWMVKSRNRSKLSAQTNSGTAISLVRVTIPLITVTMSSVLILLPALVVEIVELSTPAQQDYIEKAWDITNMITLINHAMNFYILVGSTKYHRQTLKKALGFGKKRKKREGVYSITAEDRSTAITMDTTDQM